MKKLIMILTVLSSLLFPSTFVVAAEGMCNVCNKDLTECICEDEIVTRETMDSAVAVPSMVAVNYGGIALGAGIGIGAAGFFAKKEKALLLNRKNKRKIYAVDIRKRKEGYQIRLPSHIRQETILQFTDKFVMKNEGYPLYLLYKNEEYETLISSEIYINQEEENEK